MDQRSTPPPRTDRPPEPDLPAPGLLPPRRGALPGAGPQPAAEGPDRVRRGVPQGAAGPPGHRGRARGRAAAPTARLRPQGHPRPVRGAADAAGCRVLVVGNRDSFCGDLQLLLALYGRDWEALVGGRPPLWQTELKFRGFLGIGMGETPYNRRFSAVAVINGWVPWTDPAHIQWLLFDNPHARVP